MEAISPVELIIPMPRVVLEEIQEGTDGTHDMGRLADLEGLEEKREMARKRSQRYQQRMAKAYEQTVHPRIFAEGQLVLSVAEHVRKNILGPSKFALKWEWPYIIKEAHDSGYYYLAKEDETSLIDSINEKWLKQYDEWEGKGSST